MRERGSRQRERPPRRSLAGANVPTAKRVNSEQVSMERNACQGIEMNESKVWPKRRRSFARAVEGLALLAVVVGCSSPAPSTGTLPSFQGSGGAGQTAVNPDGLAGSSALGGGANTPGCSGAGCACPAGQTSCSGSLLGGQSDQSSCVDTS